MQTLTAHPALAGAGVPTACVSCRHSSEQRPPSLRRTYRVPRVSVCSTCIFSPGLRRGGAGREEEVGDRGGCGAGDTGAPAASSPLLSTCIHLEISTIVKKKEFTKWIEAIPLTQLIHTDNGGVGSSHTSGQCPKTKCTPRHAVVWGQQLTAPTPALWSYPVICTHNYRSRELSHPIGDGREDEKQERQGLPGAAVQ